MIKANVRLDTHSCFQTTTTTTKFFTTTQDSLQRAAVSHGSKEPRAAVCTHASFHALIQLPWGSQL